ncbi:YkoF family thiamine/hydroxymethylpyrimidine-binding protein [Anaerobaca lacustris]|uniref:YkoF family thiamine/hydroxymethylpyrimidine-binding protein n=1 Tax=Anaerobaca lacustris TaxID=3044600 RepID=A0AAW6U5Y0_9BACT|nr:YkoF family thiamine/hydroxymethylpyrimidine-binding protein [Sedimentisphaerales bacterium M17dextr]
MKIQAEVSLYPLRIRELSDPIVRFCEILRSHGLDVQTRSMSTLAAGESNDLFGALQDGFERLAQENQLVMDVKISNACPDTAKQNAEIERMD